MNTAAYTLGQSLSLFQLSFDQVSRLLIPFAKRRGYTLSDYTDFWDGYLGN